MTILLKNSQERTRFYRFLIVGTIGAIVDFGVMNLLTKFLHMPLVWAGTISFICAVLSNFTWNRFWTYPDSRSKPVYRQLTQFYLINIMGVGIRLPILSFLEPVLINLFWKIENNLAGMDVNFLSKNMTLAVAVLVVLFWNFFANRYWTYSDV